MSTFTTTIKTGITRLFSPPRTVVLEGTPSLEIDPLGLISTFEKVCAQIDTEKGSDLNIDLTNVSFIYPSALLFLLALGETFGKNVSIKIFVTKKSPIHEYLNLSGFGRHFEIPALPDGFRPSMIPGQVLELESSSSISDENKKAHWFIERLNAIQNLHPALTSNSVESVEEVLRNIKQHSNYTNWYGLGQVYPTSKKVRLVFYDNGEGIKKQLTKSSYSKKHPVFKNIISKNEYRLMQRNPSNSAIKAAALKLVSSTNYKDNSGAGLDFLISEFSVAFSGTITILSGNGIVTWSNGKILHDLALPFEIKGTMVSIVAQGFS
jgi:hypothetical protein